MATSGSKSVTVTSWDTLKFSWSIKSQSVANNTSTVSWKLELISTSSGRIDSSSSKSWSVTIDGTKFSGTNTVGIGNNTTKTLASSDTSGTVTIPHDLDGTKTFNYSFSQSFSGIKFSEKDLGTKSGSGTGTLTTIARKSTLSASNGTLGTAQTLTINRSLSRFTHTIKYTCGSASGTIATKTTGTSVSFTPPLSLASQNTTGTSVSVKFTITTYSGSTSLGSNTKTITCSIPSSVKPSCSISVSDTAGYSVFVKGRSNIKVTVTPTTSYGSAIASYSVKANGLTYTSASVTVGAPSSSGTMTITATVKDKRGRTGTATKTITVYDKSTVSARSDEILGNPVDLYISEHPDSFKHTIQYSCGSVSGYILGSSDNPSALDGATLIPSKDLAMQNKTGTTVPITFTLTTYCDGKSLGINTITKNCTIPDTREFKPSVSISATDSAGYSSLYGAMVKGLSKLKINLTPTTAYGSEIASYNTVIEGQKYTTSYFEVGLITSTSDIKITTTVTDKRGRTGTATHTVTGILDYSPPTISKLTVGRCNEDGTPSNEGEFAKVTYSVDVFHLNNLNKATCNLFYKKTNETEYTLAESVDGVTSLTDKECVFLADSGSSYNILLTVQDDHNTSQKGTSVSTGAVILHFGKDGKGVAVGKVSELLDAFEVAWDTYIKKSLNIGAKTGYVDGKTGVYINKDGYIHLQRNGQPPYISFLINDETASRAVLRYNPDYEIFEFYKAKKGYSFDHDLIVSANSKQWDDGLEGTRISPSGGIVIQRIKDSTPYLYFRLYGTTSGCDAGLSLDPATKYLNFIKAARYVFDNNVEASNVYANGGMRIGNGDATGKTTAQINTYWLDGSPHNLVSRSSDGLTSQFGWVGSADYSTVTALRGQTCKYGGSSGLTTLSDERLKKDFSDLLKWEAFFNSLEPCAFRMKGGASGRYHMGFKAQQVEKALLDNGLTTKDFAGFVKTKYTPDEDDLEGAKVYEEAGIEPGAAEYGLIYTEFTALNTYMIQKLLKDNAILNEKVDSLEKKIANLEKLLNEKNV